MKKINLIIAVFAILAVSTLFLAGCQNQQKPAEEINVNQEEPSLENTNLNDEEADIDIDSEINDMDDEINSVNNDDLDDDGLSDEELGL